MEDPRLACLIDSHIAGVLNAEERSELEHLLEASPAARDQFDRHVALHALLSGTEPVGPPGAAAASLEPVRATENPVGRFSWLSLAPGWLVSWRAALAGAAALVMAGGVAWFALGNRDNAKFAGAFAPPVIVSTSLVATVLHAADVRWSETTNPVALGDSIAARSLRIESGAIQLQFKRGARVLVEGPAHLQLVSDNEAFLHYGRIRAHVPEQARGFRITSPRAAVTDFGTEFGFNAPSNSPAEVHVFLGEVGVARPGEATPRSLSQSQAVRIQDARLRSIRATERAFMSEDILVERETAELKARYERWKEAARELSRDPATIVHYTFEDQTVLWDLRNHVPSASPSTVGRIIACDWTDGRWPNKQALSFQSRSNRIRLSVPNTLTSLTYMAWVRVDGLMNLSNALVLTENMQLGEIHWQIYRDGRIALSPHSGNGTNVDQTWDRGISPPVFTAERLGKWTQIVSVYDSAARSLRHYLNGELVSSTPVKRVVKLKPGTIEIGNWGVRVDQPRWESMKGWGASYLNRNFKGKIDEFALLSRALSAEEIRRYYQEGSPSAPMLVTQGR